MLRWGQANIDRVHGLVFITYRTAKLDEQMATDTADQRGGPEQAQLRPATTSTRSSSPRPRCTRCCRTNCPEYDAAGYLGGTVRHDTLQVAGRRAHRRAKARCTARSARRRWRWRRQAITCSRAPTWPISPRQRSAGWAFLMAPWDGKVRKALAAAAWATSSAHPGPAVRARSTCRASASSRRPTSSRTAAPTCATRCPDITIYDGKFINSCRMDEYRLFGGFVSLQDKEKADREALPEAVKN